MQPVSSRTWTLHTPYRVDSLIASHRVANDQDLRIMILDFAAPVTRGAESTVGTTASAATSAATNVSSMAGKTFVPVLKLLFAFFLFLSTGTGGSFIWTSSWPPSVLQTPQTSSQPNGTHTDVHSFPPLRRLPLQTDVSFNIHSAWVGSLHSNVWPF